MPRRPTRRLVAAFGRQATKSVGQRIVDEIRYNLLERTRKAIQLEIERDIQLDAMPRAL